MPNAFDLFEGRVMLRRAEVEQLLGLEEGLLNQWHKRGIDIPYFQIGGTSARVYDRNQILAWWESKKRIGKQPANGSAAQFTQPASYEDVQRQRHEQLDADAAKRGNFSHERPDRPSFDERMAARKNGKA